MNKIKLLLEDEEENKDLQVSEPENITEEKPEEMSDELIGALDETPEFITSDELNQIREILLDIPDDIQLLLLNDDVIVMATVDNGKTYLYTLQNDESNEFGTIEMPTSLENILTNQDIIKYTPDNIDNRHQTIVDILMNKLSPTTTEEPNEDIEEPTEEDDIDEIKN